MNRKLKSEELSRIDNANFKKSEKFEVIVILDNIRSGNNVGSVFRTSDAFRLEAIYLCGITAQPPQRDIQKTALGATETVSWEYFNNTLDAVDAARDKGFTVMSIEQTKNALMLDQFDPEAGKKYAIVLGNEVRGVQQQVIDKCDGSIEIPQFGTKHSFNISVSAGIILWDLYLKTNPFE
ncbi:MAG: TrmH family RNA methyltransferase [Bacteroidetes bacterium]|nr:MAG: TrmH family RNA methyltransferase [Bacteroidota bacterium]